MIKLALSALSEFSTMSERMRIESAASPRRKERYTMRRLSNHYTCKGLVMHDRILTGKRPL